MRFRLLATVFACMPLWNAFADLPPIEAYGRLPEITSAQISPDGKKVAAITNFSGTTRLVVYDIDKGPVKHLTIKESKARSVTFHDNNHVILRASETTRTSGFQGEYEFSAAFSVALDKNNPVQLLRRTTGIFPAQSGLGKIVGSGKKPGYVLMPAFMGGLGQKPTYDLLTVNMDTGPGRVHVRGTDDTIDWFSDAQGSILARERYSNSRNEYKIQRYVNKNWVTVFEEKNVNVPPMSILGVMPDSSGLIFIQTNQENGGFDWLMKLDFNGDISGPVLATDTKEIDTVYQDNERRVLGVRYAGAHPSYEFLDSKLEASYKSILGIAPNATIYLDSWSDDRTHVLYNIFDASVGDIWMIHEAESNRIVQIANNRPDLNPDQIGIVAAINYQSRDGLTIPAIVTAPASFSFDAPTPHPLIVMPHGGPAEYDRIDFNWMAQYFTSRGYIVLQPNFRGSTGYGQDFKEAGRGEWAGKMQDDITDGVYALQMAGYANSSETCIVGGSYGGYAALAGAVFTPELYKCIVAIAPVSDIPRMLADTKRERGQNHWVIDYWEEIILNGDTRREKLESISPVNFAKNARAPILLLHGDDDTTVPIEQSRRMNRALERANKDVTFVVLKGEDHWISVEETRIQLLNEIDLFLREHMPIPEKAAP